jgi:nucleotide-binding universal stress UspA family protein
LVGTPAALSIGYGRIVSISTQPKAGNRMMDCRMKILIEYDGSRRADDAIEDLQNAGQPREAKAKIVSVVEPIMPTGMPEISWSVAYAQVTEREIRLSRLAVREACERLMVRTASFSAVMIAAGSGRFFFGSTAAAVASKAQCTVEVLREKERRLIAIDSDARRRVPRRAVFGTVTQVSAQRAS